MLVGIIESVAQGMIDYHVATALLTGIMSGTEGFTAPNTTAKSLTIAAQMMSGGAKQQDIVKVLFSQEPKTAQPQLEAAKTPKPSSEKAETIAEKLAKKGVELTQGGVVDSQTGEAVAEEAEVATQSEVEQSPKKFKNHSQKQ
jgi:nanoRNase/pAp phosphatase (c-di-AMP/oligoRNAs hydrolase)